MAGIEQAKDHIDGLGAGNDNCAINIALPNGLRDNRKNYTDCKIGDRVRVEHKYSGQLPQLGTIVSFDDYDQKPVIRFHDHHLEAKVMGNQTIVPLIKAWLSTKIRLDEFNNKEQAFVITAWINVFWRIEDNDESKFSVIHSPTAARHRSGQKLLSHLRNFVEKADIPISQSSHPVSPSKISKKETVSYITNAKTICYKNNLHQKIIKILDLRNSSLSYYLPIDATKIFCETSLQFIEHNHPPSLYYNQQTQLVHTQYHIKAKLFEHLELHDFPFDRQFLNIKLRWNTNYYHLLDWSDETERMIPIREKWWNDDKSTILTERRRTLYHTTPIRIHLAESLRAGIHLLDPWVDFSFRQFESNQQESNENDIDPARHALIRLRIKRNPTYYVLNILIPFFIIVSCCFSVFALELTDIGERLSISIFILFAFTAFQEMSNKSLPQTSETVLMDKYILLAYCIQGLVIVGISAIPTLIARFVEDNDTLILIENVWQIVLGSIWICFSLYYLSKIRTNECDFRFWQDRAAQEMANWISSDKVTTKYIQFGHRKYNRHSFESTIRTSMYQNNVGYGATGWVAF